MTTRGLASFLLLLGLSLPPAIASAGTLTGVVTDFDGRPVAGVPLWAVFSFDQEEQGEDLPPSAFSGADGSFAIPGVPAGEIVLHACGEETVYTYTTVRSLQEPVHLKVEHGVRLRGRIAEPDGMPISGARVLARELPWVACDHCVFDTPRPPCPEADWATSDDDGRFAFGPLAPGQYRIEPYADGFTGNDAPVVRLQEGEEPKDLDVRLKSDGSLMGRVTDVAGKPIYSTVRCTPEGGETDAVLTNMDGWFRFFAGDRPVTFQIEVENYEPLQQTVEHAAAMAPVHLTLVRDTSWKTLRGRVTGPGGAPVEGAWISTPGGDFRTVSAADGSFEVTLPMEEFHYLFVEKPGFATEWLSIYPDRPPRGPLQVLLQPGATVNGTVHGVTPGDRSLETRVSLENADGDPALRAPLQADDTFRFDNVPPGEWELTLSTASREMERRLVLKPGEAVAVELSLPRTGRVSGKVLDAVGRPVAGAEIAASVAGSVVSGLTRSDGRFTLRVPQGGVHLAVSHPEFLDQQVEVQAAHRQALMIHLERATLMTGHLAGCSPGQNPELVAILDEPTRTITSIGWIEDCQYKIGLEPGVWTFQAIRYGAAGTSHTVRWAPLEIERGVTEKELDLDLALAEVVP